MRNVPRSLLWVTLGMIVANLAGEMYYPILPLYLESLGATVQEVGVFFTLQVVLAICFRILGGWISDHMGRLPTIALGSIFGMGAITGYTLAPTWEWAALGALMAAVGSSLVGPSFQAFIAEQAPEGRMSSTFGLINGLFLICAVIGPPVGGYMADHVGFKTMMWVATAIFYSATAMRVWMAWGSRFEVKDLQPSQLARDMRVTLGLLVGGGVLTWLFLIDGLSDAGNQVAFPFLPKYITQIRDMPKTTYGILMALTSLVSALAMWPCGRLAGRWRSPHHRACRRRRTPAPRPRPCRRDPCSGCRPRRPPPPPVHWRPAPGAAPPDGRPAPRHGSAGRRAAASR